MYEPTLTEIADRIRQHLRRFEADPEINPRNETFGTKRFYNAGASRAGAYVGVSYVSYQHRSNLTRAEAVAYLAWLDAGNVGRHFEQQREAASSDV